MKYLKATSVSVILAFTAFFATSANAGIPVIDVTAIVNLAEQYAEQILQYEQQVEQYSKQLEQLTEARNAVTQLTNTYDSMTGDRGLGTILNGVGDQAARRYLPTTYDDVSALSGTAPVSGYGGLQSLVASLKPGISSIPPGTYPVGSDAQAVLDNDVNTLANQKAIGTTSYDSVVAHTSTIKNLIATIGSATDPKAIGEIQARIGAEQALTQNESNKLKVMAYMQNVEKAQAQQKVNDLLVKHHTVVATPYP